jgi:LPXTG-motif cell wall-anchored protein
VSINRRTAIAVRSIGVASAAAALALGVAGNAFACNIGDFSASATCDTASGQGSITVVDTDATRPVVITVSQNGTQVAQQEFDDNGTDTFVVPVQWSPSTQYTVHVKVGSILDKDVSGGVTTPAEACAAPSSPPASPSPSPSSASPSAPATTAPSTPATSPSSTSSSSAPAAAGTNAPSPAAGGSQSLAETGGGSDTGLIAAIAAALVAVGAGSVFALRRRNPAARH